MNLILVLTEGDPWGLSTGGQTTFTKHLLTAFSIRLAVSSHCEDEAIPVGEWVQRPYNESYIWFFNRGPFKKKMDRKPLLPERIRAYFIARKFMPKIRGIKMGSIIIDSPEMLMVAAPYKWEHILYRFAGVNNFVSNSRYPRLRCFGKLIELFHINLINRVKPDVMIASADQDAIEDFFQRINYKIDKSRFYRFPTRVDTAVFSPIEVSIARNKLNFSKDKKIFVTTGRISWVKGWELLLESFVLLKKTFPDSVLVFVGDGEDRSSLLAKARRFGILESILITGFIPQNEVALYMNAADVCLVGSYLEGWSLAMCEIIACGKPLVSTNVSGAKDMICGGKNGFIVPNRNPKFYAEAIFSALNLNDVKGISLKISEKYAVKNLAHDLGSIWEPLRAIKEICCNQEKEIN